MSGPALLIVTAAVLSVDGGMVRIDKGLADGLRPGDHGVLFYELRIGDRTRAFEVGHASVVEVTQTSAIARAGDGVEAQPGHEMRFNLPGDRLRLAQLIEAARSHLGEVAREQAMIDLIDDWIPDDESLENRVVELIEERRGRRLVAREPAAGPPPRPPALAAAAGRYRIGVDLPAARYFNQQPSFEARVDDFVIDRAPVARAALAWCERGGEAGPTAATEATESPAREVNWEEAAECCRALGGRLPSEIEWEVAAALPGFAAPGYLFEWTSSWYRAYEGNSRREPEYGTSRKVLRRLGEGGEEARHRRYFADPELRSDDVGFRCVHDGENAAAR